MKLYRSTPFAREYWETWEAQPGVYTVHWGVLGSRGSTKNVNSSFLRSAGALVQQEIEAKLAEGFAPIEPEDHDWLIIEYRIDGFGSETDLDKRHRLEDVMNELLGWTGLGACDGGSIGSNSMEVANMVVDYDIAKSVVEGELSTGEFSDYSRIYREGRD